MIPMASKANNPMSEYLLKLQLIVSNTEFKNKEEADKYETLETRLAGDDYVETKLGKDVFESYNFSESVIKRVLILLNYPEEMILKCIQNPQLIPQNVKDILVKRAGEQRINAYHESNKYYLNLMGMPLEGTDPIFPVEEDFYQLYVTEGGFPRECPIHLLPEKYIELYQNSEYYAKIINENPNVEYLKHMGSNAIPLEVSRKAKDGEIMKINTKKLSTSHEIFGQVTVSPDIIHQFVNAYKKTHKYIYQTLRGDFSYIYPNYNSLIRLLAIYFTIGTCMNEFMHKSTKLIYMNNAIADDYFTLYGLPSVLMESNSLINFLKKFRQLLMDKGTNTVYRVKDIIGYQYTDIFTMVMVKQQVFHNGVPIYYIDPDTGERLPKQNIYFRKLGTADNNTSYFQFKNEKKNYTVEEITSGDPRWWNTPEVQRMINDMNYTLSNSKYIMLSTTMDMDDIWWQTCILLRGLLDNRKETQFTNIGLSQSLNGKNSMNVFEAALLLIIMMTWNHSDFMGNHFAGNMYLPNGQLTLGRCVDMLFNGLNDDGSPRDLVEGWPFKISSFNFEIKIRERNKYDTLSQYQYLQPELTPMLDSILNRENISVGESIMSEIKNLFNYLETKLRTASTIHEFRQVTDAYNWLFLVDPYRDGWYDYSEYSTTQLLMKSYGIAIADLNALYRFFNGDDYALYVDNSNDIQRMELTDDARLIKFYRNVDITDFDYQLTSDRVYSDFHLPDDAMIGIHITESDHFNPILLGMDQSDGSKSMVPITALIGDNDIWHAGIMLSEYGEIISFELLSFKGNPNDAFWKFDKIVLSSEYESISQGEEYTDLNFNFDMYVLSDKTLEIVDIGKVLNLNTNVLEIYPDFADTGYLRAFMHMLEKWTCPDIYNAPLSPILKTNYKNIISDKIMLDLSNTQYGPRSFEALLYLTNPELYRFIQNLHGDGEQLLILMRSIIRALENYVQSPLPALEFEATGQKEYIRILKEVITYFKSYMVEFTKSEFQYLFGGLFDHGGNSNMLLLFDEINHITLRMIPRDALHLYDVSCAKARVIVKDDISNFLYDEALFRVKTTYGNLKQLGFEIWFDHEEYIDMTPFDDLSNDTILIAEIHEDTSGTYKIIINQDNI
jgi:hypothetical protein